MHKSFKFRLYPNTTPSIALAKTFGCVRFMWNKRVADFNTYAVIGPNLLNLSTTEIRRKYIWMTDVSAAALQQKDMDFIEFKKQYFNKKRAKLLGRPTFKKKSNKQSFRLPSQKFKIINNTIKLEKISAIRFNSCGLAIPTNAKLINITVSKDTDGNYYASVLVDITISQLPKTGKSTGIDLGLTELLTLSDGSTVENLRLYRKSQAKLGKLQKRFSKKIKGSNRSNKAKLKIARLHSCIARQRNHQQHVISYQLVTEYDFIGLETLNISGMMKNRKLAKSMQDAGLSSLVEKIKYKAVWYGKEVQQISMWFPSSKLCSGCGVKHPNLQLSDRIYNCQSCGLSIGRDHNAAINIEVEALRVNNAKRAQSDSKTASDISPSSELRRSA